MRISPSEVVGRAAGLVPRSGFEAEAPGYCALCAHPIHKGDPAVPIDTLFNTASFTDWNALTPGQPAACGWCAEVATAKITAFNPATNKASTGDFTQTYANMVATPDGLYPFRSNVHRAYFLLHPPEPPYVIAVSTQQRQHLYWMAPVNHSQRLVFVLHGRQVLAIRPDRLLPARQAHDALTEALNKILKRAGDKRRKTPFAAGVMASGGGAKAGPVPRVVLDGRLYEAAQDDAEVTEALDLLTQLTPGEMWALKIIAAVPDPESLERPEPFQIK